MFGKWALQPASAYAINLAEGGSWVKKQNKHASSLVYAVKTTATLLYDLCFSVAATIGVLELSHLRVPLSDVEVERLGRV